MKPVLLTHDSLTSRRVQHGPHPLWTRTIPIPYQRFAHRGTVSPRAGAANGASRNGSNGRGKPGIDPDAELEARRYVCRPALMLHLGTGTCIRRNA